MARPNARSRQLAKLRLYDDMAHRATVAANTEPLQSGKVRSCLTSFSDKIGSLRPSMPVSEGLGKRIRTSHKRWGQK